MVIVSVPVEDLPMPVPVGTVVREVLSDGLRIAMNYDYSPFVDPYAPAFDFDAALLHADGTLTPITCTSHPGRYTSIKEQ